MQPYFFPYIGYFQLIKSVDVYVNLDHVSFMKRSYMTRNTLKDKTQFNIPVYNGSQNKKCSEVYVNFENNYNKKILNKIHHLYSKSEYYENIIPHIEPLFDEKKITISEFNINTINKICKLLDIKTKIINSSNDYTTLKKADGLIEISKKVGGTDYVNAIGGQKLYDKTYFKKNDLNLHFINMKEVNFENPYSSIMDLLFTYPLEKIKKELNNYELI